jgi:phosphoglycolate phosphatase
VPELLVLWDIDHTLVDTCGVGLALFAEAFRETTGLEMEQQSTPDGRTEPVIFRETAALHGLVTGRDEFEAFARALGVAHLRRAAELRERGHALPGASSLLTELAAREGLVQTVVTGNIRMAAEVKLGAFGLDRHLALEVGAFGEDADNRADLVRLALERSGTSAGRAVIVGDTPADVQAGLDAGVRVVAVATGRTSADDLRAAGATEVVLDLSDTTGMLKLLTG